MTHFDDDDLPPDLSDLGGRMRRRRPVADDATLDRIMQRAQTPEGAAPRRAPRRAFAVSLGTTLAMVSVTGVAAASLFGLSFGHIGSALTSSNQKVGQASSQALRAPAPALASAPASSATSASKFKLPSATGSGGALGSIAGVRPSGGAASSAIIASPSANRHRLDDDDDDDSPNAGFFQYGPGRLV